MTRLTRLALEELSSLLVRLACSNSTPIKMPSNLQRGKGVKRISNTEIPSPAERHAAMTWAQRLKRVFSIDIEVFGRCGGSVRVIADASDRCIE